MATTKTLTGKSNLSAAAAIVPATVSLNGDQPLMYRIGNTDRVVMGFSESPNGFLVYNQSNGNVYQTITLASSTLSGGITNLATTITLASGTSFPAGNPNSFILCEGEVMNVVSRSSNTLTVKRGQQQTSAVAHLLGATVTYTIWTSWGSVGNLDAFDPTLINRWFATTASNAGIGYRIGVTDRTLGDPTDGYPEGFLVLNQTNSNVFQAQGGIWIDGGVFDADLLTAWTEA